MEQQLPNSSGPTRIPKFIGSETEVSGIARGSAVSLLAMCRATLILGEREHKGGPQVAARSSNGRKLRSSPFHRGENTPFVSSNAPTNPSRPSFHPPCSFLSPPPPSSLHARAQPSVTLFHSSHTSSELRVPGIMKGPSKRKSIDDAARSTSFNPHRARSGIHSYIKRK